MNNKLNTSDISKGESVITGQIPTSQDSDSNQMVRTKSSPIKSVRQLIEQVYSGTLKSKKFSKSELAGMRQMPALSDEEINELVKMTNEDRTLRYTFILFDNVVKNQNESFTVTEQIGKFAKAKLESHPAFKGHKLHSPVDNVMQFIANFNRYEKLRWPDESQLKRNEVKVCWTNAISCFLVWLMAFNKTPFERILEYLLNYKWKPSARQSKTDADKVLLLTKARELESLAISNEVLHKDVSNQKKRAESAELANERSQNEVMLLKKKLRDRQLMLSDTQKEAESLRLKLENEYQERANDNAHLKDDIETLRGRVLRRLNDELVLLEEGLKALRRNPPKIEVMVDHAERAIDGLKSECERLLKRGDN